MITRETIQKGANRMIENERQAVRAAVKAGAKVVSCGRYYEGGPLVLTVTKPDSWMTEIWRDRKTLNCIVPAGREIATMEWAAARM